MHATGPQALLLLGHCYWRRFCVGLGPNVGLVEFGDLFFRVGPSPHQRHTQEHEQRKHKQASKRLYKQRGGRCNETHSQTLATAKVCLGASAAKLFHEPRPELSSCYHGHSWNTSLPRQELVFGCSISGTRGSQTQRHFTSIVDSLGCCTSASIGYGSASCLLLSLYYGKHPEAKNHIGDGADRWSGRRWLCGLPLGVPLSCDTVYCVSSFF